LYAYSKGKGQPWYPNGYMVEAYGPDGYSINATKVATNDTNLFAFHVTDKNLNGQTIEV
jgi:hypothetical protein